jgi:hypothetical protein
MGGAFSSAVGGPVTRQQLLDATRNNREFVQKLFNVMLNQLTREDLLKLGDQRTCNKYVFLMADTIDKMFKALKIRPSRDKSTGVIYFEKVESLTQRTPETRTYCLEIAYFYIRIFQIFGALALSILDDPSAGTILGAASYIEPPAGRGFGFGFGRRPSVPGLEYAMFGGAVDSELSDDKSRQFRVIKDELGDKGIDPVSRKEAFLFVENTDLVLIPGRDKQNLRFTFTPGIYMYSKLTIVKKTLDGQTLEVTLSNFNLTDSTKRNLEVINRQLYSVTHKFKLLRNETGRYLTPNGNSITDTLVSKFDTIYRQCEEVEADPRKTIPSGIAPDRALKRDAVAGAATQLYGVAAGETAQRQLQTKYIIDTMKQMAGTQKTTSFCVARALQLLDAPTLFSPRTASTAKSGVCLSKFDRLPTAVPESGAPISRVSGIKALDQLYHTAPHLDARDGTTVDVGEPEQYQAMLKLLATTFTGKEPTRLTTIDAILAKSPDCSSAAAKHYLKLTDPKAIKEVITIAQQMFGRQLSHTRRVIDFLTKKLVRIYKEGSGQKISLHPNILKGGIQEINKLSAEARQILVEYYKGCEDLYQQGLRKVVSSRGLEIVP